MHTCSFTAMGDSCSGSEEHAILLGALAVLQQISSALMQEIKMEDPKAFANFVRMDAQQVHYFLDAVSPFIVHKEAAMRDAIPRADRLAVTLRFIAITILHNYVNVMLTFQ